MRQVSNNQIQVTGYYMHRHGTIGRIFGRIANCTSHYAGRASAFALASSIILIWALTGPYFNFSDTWQLVINTSTTIVTFLMVFLIQNSQNRDGAAIQVKLDELIRVSKVHNTLVGIEHLTEEELDELRQKCETRARTELKSINAVVRSKLKSQRPGRKITR
jgi:low affinity Fe/Cu permease